MNSNSGIEIKKENHNQEDEIMDLKDESNESLQMINPVKEKSESETENSKGKVFISSDPRKIYKCDLCKKGFSRVYSLQRHMKSHTGAKLFQCNFCDKKFAQNDYLKKHKARKHYESKNIKCLICEKTFPRKSNLDTHNRLTHKYDDEASSRRNFFCYLCEK